MKYSENELLVLSENFDNFFADMCLDNGINPVDMTAIILARMSRISFEAGYTKEYHGLLTKVTKHVEGIKETPNIETFHASAAVH